MGNSAGLPSASIRSQSGVHFYRIGERHKSGFEVIDIQNRFVILQNGREKEVLPLIPKSAERITSNRNDNNPRPGKKRGIRNHWLREGIKTLGSNKYSISRSTLNRILSNTVELTRARIIPAITGGKSTGFRIYSIRPGSLFALLGMKNGDQVHAINARAIHTPEQALQAYAMLRSANHLSLAFTRRGKRMTSDYTITR
jgi:type II secretory pathway component PulC